MDSSGKTSLSKSQLENPEAACRASDSDLLDTCECDRYCGRDAASPCPAAKVIASCSSAPGNVEMIPKTGTFRSAMGNFIVASWSLRMSFSVGFLAAVVAWFLEPFIQVVEALMGWLNRWFERGAAYSFIEEAVQRKVEGSDVAGEDFFAEPSCLIEPSAMTLSSAAKLRQRNAAGPNCSATENTGAEVTGAKLPLPRLRPGTAAKTFCLFENSNVWSNGVLGRRKCSQTQRTFVTRIFREERDLEDAASVLSAGFATDPLFRFLVPNADVRHAIARTWFKLNIRLARREVILEEWEEQEKIVGVAVVSSASMTGYEGFVGLIYFWLTLFSIALRDYGTACRLFCAAMSFTRKSNEILQPFGTRYSILKFLAVEKGFQGSGIGSNLLRTINAQLDRYQRPGYLESSNIHNVVLYERYGFRLIESWQPMVGAPPVFLMFRSGHAAGNAAHASIQPSSRPACDPAEQSLEGYAATNHILTRSPAISQPAPSQKDVDTGTPSTVSAKVGSPASSRTSSASTERKEFREKAGEEGARRRS